MYPIRASHGHNSPWYLRYCLGFRTLAVFLGREIPLAVSTPQTFRTDMKGMGWGFLCRTTWAQNTNVPAQSFCLGRAEFHDLFVPCRGH